MIGRNFGCDFVPSQNVKISVDNVVCVVTFPNARKPDTDTCVVLTKRRKNNLELLFLFVTYAGEISWHGEDDHS